MWCSKPKYIVMHRWMSSNFFIFQTPIMLELCNRQLVARYVEMEAQRSLQNTWLEKDDTDFCNFVCTKTCLCGIIVAWIHYKGSSFWLTSIFIILQKHDWNWMLECIIWVEFSAKYVLYTLTYTDILLGTKLPSLYTKM